MRILHTGDWHIGSFPGPETNGTNARFLDCQKILASLVQRAKKEAPDVVVVAGDMYHQARVWGDRALQEVQVGLQVLQELMEISPVVLLRGTPNHDGAEQFETMKDVFGRSDRIHIVTEPCIVTVDTKGGSVQFACVPGFDRGVYRAKDLAGLSKEEENRLFTEMTAAKILELSANCRSDVPKVLVSHHTIAGANMESGQTVLFGQFDPVVTQETLQRADFNLACFGHIHRGQQIPGCKDTFYCGALMELNFNDEGQERGYYVHDLDAGSRAVDSQFRSLNGRRFLTVSLDQDDMADFLEDGSLALPGPVAGRMVRVQYRCTEEQQKQFEPAKMEKALLGQGAFYVQDIVPVEIAAAADIRSLDGNNDPMENLRQYLDGRELPAEADEILAAAEPVVLEETAALRQDTVTGTFMPVSIRVENYRNYRSETFEYDKISFCLVNGSNGTGKSSLFMDAMLDALYEETREGDLTGWISSDPAAKHGIIEFVFDLGSRRYRVVRTRSKKSGATLNLAELVDGEWVNRSKERMRDTQAEITRLVGMDSMTLKACGLIMQDQYGLFLQAGKDERMDILGGILGLGIYGRLEERCGEQATECNRRIKSLREQIGQIEINLLDEKALQESQAMWMKHAEDARAELERENAALAALRTELGALRQTVQEEPEAERQLREVTAEQASKQEAVTAWQQEKAAAEAVLAREAEIRAGVAAYQAGQEQLRQLAQDRTAWTMLEQQATAAENEARTAEHGLGQAQAKQRDIEADCARRLAELQAMDPSGLERDHGEFQEVQRQLQSPEVQQGMRDYYMQQTAVQAAEQDLRSHAERHALSRSQQQKEAEVLQSKIAMLQQSGCIDIERAGCVFLRDAQGARDALSRLEAVMAVDEDAFQMEQQSREAALEAARTALRASEQLAAEVDRLQARNTALAPREASYQASVGKQNELAQVQAELNRSYEEIRQGSERLMACRQQVQDIRIRQAAVSTAAAQYDAVQAQLERDKAWLDQQQALAVSAEKRTMAEQMLGVLAQDLAGIGVKIAAAEQRLAAVRSARRRLEMLMPQETEAERRVAAAQQQSDGAARELAMLQAKFQQLAQQQAQIAELNRQAVETSHGFLVYDTLKKAFGQDGIPHDIVRSVISDFEATASAILMQMSGGHMRVEMVLEKNLRSNRKKEVTTLDVIIHDDVTGSLPYLSRSGGERVKAALAVILALAEIKSSQAGVQMGFLFIDESPFLDADGTQAYVDALEAIQSRYPDTKILAITHDEGFKARFPQTVEVYKDDSGSHLRPSF